MIKHYRNFHHRHVNVMLHSVKYPIYATQTNNNNRRHSIVIDRRYSINPSTLVIKIPSSTWINSACMESSIIEITTLRSSDGGLLPSSFGTKPSVKQASSTQPQNSLCERVFKIQTQHIYIMNKILRHIFMRENASSNISLPTLPSASLIHSKASV
jgi:hypothetical protein